MFIKFLKVYRFSPDHINIVACHVGDVVDVPEQFAEGVLAANIGKKATKKDIADAEKAAESTEDDAATASLTTETAVETGSEDAGEEGGEGEEGAGEEGDSEEAGEEEAGEGEDS